MELNKLSDEDLLRMLKNTDSSLILADEVRETLVKRYTYMAKFMLRNTRLKYHKSEEEDLICHGYLLINDAINRYNPDKGCKFKSFLYFVLKKGILNQFFQKDKFRNNEMPLTNICDDYDFNTIDSLSGGSNNLSAYDELILKEQVTDMKSSLTESEYNCVMARYYGASYKETAKTFGYTPKQVDNKIQSVRKVKLKSFNASF